MQKLADLVGRIFYVISEPHGVIRVQGVQRYVVFSFLIGAGLLWVTLSRIFQAVAFALNAPDIELLGSQFTLSKAISMGISLAGVFVAVQNEGGD